jgi:hypothetical protein
MFFFFSTERTRISCLAKLVKTTHAALRTESRTNFINATTLNRKFGSAVFLCRTRVRLSPILNGYEGA